LIEYRDKVIDVECDEKEEQKEEKEDSKEEDEIDCVYRSLTIKLRDKGIYMEVSLDD
jgi:hypothetical protein